MSPQGDNAEQPTSVSPPITASIIDGAKKKIYLIRHAESEENRRIAALSRTFQNLIRFSLPKASDVSTSTELLNVSAQVDSNVSDIGASQIAHMREKIREDKFVESSGIKLVVHSPLLRARQTSEGMLDCMTASSSNDTAEEKRAINVSRVVETSLLLEKKPAEWTPMYYDQFRKRISDFETWLGEQPEEVIAIVGHSQYFKAMLKLDDKFGNCEVWKVDFGVLPPREDATEGASTGATKNNGDDNPPSGNAFDSVSSGCWSNLEKVYGCEVESSPKSV
jgi:broad specificity phosphatase PhoE